MRRKLILTTIILGLPVAAAACSSCPCVGSSAAFAPAVGTGLVHLNYVQSDNLPSGIPALLSGVQLLFQDASRSGSGTAVGLTTNGTGGRMVVKYTDASPYIQVYDSLGNKQWNSGTLLDSKPGTPIMGTDGGVIDADDHNIIRWDGNGNMLWCTALPYSGVGAPGRPAGSYNNTGALVVGNDVVLMTQFGPFAMFDSGSGAVIGSSLFLDPTCSGSCTANWCGLSGGCDNFYVNTNSSCWNVQPVTGYNVVYITAAQETNSAIGKMFAVKVDPSAGLSIVSRSPVFNGASGASPMCSPDGGIFTDTGNGNSPPGIIGFTDNGDGTFTTRFGGLGSGTGTGSTYGIYANLGANFNYDPVNNVFWTHGVSDGHLVGHSVTTGLPANTCGGNPCVINTNSLISGCSTCWVSSDTAITSNSSGHSVMYASIRGTNAASPLQPAYVVAFDLTALSMLWNVEFATSTALNWVGGQLVEIVTPDNRTEVAMASNSSGVLVFGPPGTSNHVVFHGQVGAHGQVTAR